MNLYTKINMQIAHSKLQQKILFLMKMIPRYQNHLPIVLQRQIWLSYKAKNIAMPY